MSRYSLFALLALSGCAASQPTSQIDSKEIFRPDSRPYTTVNYRVRFAKLSALYGDLERRFAGKLSVETITESFGHPIYRVTLPAEGTAKRRVLITAGVHGEEAIAPVAVYRLIESLLLPKRRFPQTELVIFPMLNPEGLRTNTLRLPDGKNLNRLLKTKHPLVDAFKRALAGQRFDMALDCHEAFSRRGFFVIRQVADDHGFSRRVLARVDRRHVFTSPTGRYPHDVPSRVDPKKTAYRIIAPGESFSFTDGTFKQWFQQTYQIPYAYTVEATGAVKDLGQRAEVYLQLLLSFLRELELVLPCCQD